MHAENPTQIAPSTGGRAYQFLESPLILVGSTRSGTTLLRLMLDSHPQIAFLSEFDYAFYRLGDPTHWPDPASFRDDLVNHPFFIADGYTVDPALGTREQIDHVVRQKRDRDGKPLVGVTIHHDFDRALRVWPDARFIHLFRDGRDVARSIVQMGWAGNVYRGVDEWITAETRWVELARRLPAGRRIDVRYEDLVSRPEATLAALCDFIGVPYDPAMLSYPERSTYGPPTAALAHQWRTKLAPREVAQVEARIAEMLVERGYELSGLPRLKITPWRDRYYRAESWLRAMEFARRRYGTRFILARATVKRIGPESWRQALWKWWYTMEKDYLK
jgi:hypothetical protein